MGEVSSTVERHLWNYSRCIRLGTQQMYLEEVRRSGSEGREMASVIVRLYAAMRAAKETIRDLFKTAQV